MGVDGVAGTFEEVFDCCLVWRGKFGNFVGFCGGCGGHKCSVVVFWFSLLLLMNSFDDVTLFLCF